MIENKNSPPYNKNCIAFTNHGLTNKWKKECHRIANEKKQNCARIIDRDYFLPTYELNGLIFTSTMSKIQCISQHPTHNKQSQSNINTFSVTFILPEMNRGLFSSKLYLSFIVYFNKFKVRTKSLTAIYSATFRVRDISLLVESSSLFFSNYIMQTAYTQR